MQFCSGHFWKMFSYINFHCLSLCLSLCVCDSTSNPTYLATVFCPLTCPFLTYCEKPCAQREDDKHPGRRSGIFPLIASVHLRWALGLPSVQIKNKERLRRETEGKDVDVLCSGLWSIDTSWQVGSVSWWVGILAASLSTHLPVNNLFSLMSQPIRGKAYWQAAEYTFHRPPGCWGQIKYIWKIHSFVAPQSL